jgi:hypothetical protein
VRTGEADAQSDGFGLGQSDRNRVRHRAAHGEGHGPGCLVDPKVNVRPRPRRHVDERRARRPRSVRDAAAAELHSERAARSGTRPDREIDLERVGDDVDDSGA